MPLISRNVPPPAESENSDEESKHEKSSSSAEDEQEYVRNPVIKSAVPKNKDLWKKYIVTAPDNYEDDQ